jgi:peroxiredoxin
MNPSFDVALDSQKKAVKSAGVVTMPTSYLVDQQGVIRFVHNGWHGKKSSEELAHQIEELLK